MSFAIGGFVGTRLEEQEIRFEANLWQIEMGNAG